MKIGDKVALPDDSGNIIGEATVTAVDGSRFFTADTGWVDQSELVEAWEV